MKEFNTTAICVPELHYMVDTTEKMQQIEKLIAQGNYFTINRARQYGKTTMMYSYVHAAAMNGQRLIPTWQK